VLTAGESNGLPYLVMPYVEGESLRTRLGRGRPRVAETVGILRDVARALAYAHARGIVHRDIKPDNVLLSAGSAAVADFGVAKAISSAWEGDTPLRGTLTIAGTALGTPGYMAPEQIAADPTADHRADIYGFGVMAYEMLAGEPPFQGSTRALFAAHLTEPPVPLAQHRPDIPAGLVALVMQCLAKDPADRPYNADELVAALSDPQVISGAFASSPSLDATLPMRAPGARATARRMVLAALVLAVVIAAVGTWAPMRSRGAAAPAEPTLAVLPMVYLGEDDANARLALGVTSDLTSALGGVSGLRVASANSAEALQHRLARGERVADEVGMYLEGVIQQEGEQLRIDARLVSAADGFMVWAGSYEGSQSELVALQQRMRESVVASVGERVQANPRSDP
jgi:serine/threonine-protein kinase